MLKEELVELEYTDDDILYYIDDEQGNEIGFALLEDGKETEYYYANSVEDKVNRAVQGAVDGVVDGVKDALDDNPFVSKEGVVHLKEDLNVIYKENKETVNDLRSIVQDMRDFKNFLSGKPLSSSRDNASTKSEPPVKEELPTKEELPAKANISAEEESSAKGESSAQDELPAKNEPPTPSS